MKISQNVRDYAENQQITDGLKQMKNSFIEHGQKIYHKQ